MKPTVHPRVVPSLLDVLCRLDIEVTGLWSGGDLGTHRVPLADYLRFLGRVAERAQAPDLGMHIAGSIALSDLSLFDIIGERTRHAASVRDGLDALARFHAIWMEGPRVEVSDGDDNVIVHWVPPTGFDPVGTFVDAQETVFVLARLPSLLLGRAVPGVVVTMPRLPLRVPEWVSGFDLQTGACWQVALPRQVADHQIQGSATLRRVLDDAAQQELVVAAIDVPWVERVSRGLDDRPHAVSLRTAARRLGVGPRTLQRQLATEGTTFRKLRDGAALRLTQKMLRQTDLGLDAVAEQVGLSTAAALVRAFKRWTGATPSVWRSHALGASSEPLGTSSDATS